MKIHFGPFILDSETRQLISEAEGEVRLSPKAFDVLCALAERRPNVVTKADLHSKIWPGTFVVDTSLNVLIGEIRRAVSDTPQQPRFIRTVHKVGYAFCAPVSELKNQVTSPSDATRCWLMWNDQTFRLSPGENIIGRDPSSAIWLDASGVSRQHARIEITNGSAGAVLLDDLASTNGTFLRSARVAGRERLTDGDVIHVGSVNLTFRRWSPDTPKKTDRIPRRRT